MNIEIVSDLLEADMDDLLKSSKISEDALDGVYEAVQNFIEREIIDESEVENDPLVGDVELSVNGEEEE